MAATPFNVCSLVLITMAVVAGWFALVFLWTFVDQMRIEPRFEWYHVTPTILGTVAVLCTAGASMVGRDREQDSVLFSDDYEAHRQVFRVLRLVALVGLVSGEWGLALLWAGRDWAATEIRVAFGYLLIQTPYVLALVLRWRQLVIEYHEWAAKRRSEEGLD